MSFVVPENKNNLPNPDEVFPLKCGFKTTIYLKKLYFFIIISTKVENVN